MTRSLADDTGLRHQMTSSLISCTMTAAADCTASKVASVVYNDSQWRHQNISAAQAQVDWGTKTSEMGAPLEIDGFLPKVMSVCVWSFRSRAMLFPCDGI